MNGQMSFAEFLKSTQADSAPPAELNRALKALWYEKGDQWELAHDLAQELEGVDGAWVHAYLHRKEGDVSNAAYWYRRAGQPLTSGSFPIEWENIVRSLLGDRNLKSATTQA